MPNVIANCKVKLELWTYKSNAGSSERITNLVWENIVRENLKSIKKCHKLFIEPGFIHCEMWPQAHSVQTERKLSGWSDLIASNTHSPKPYPAACIQKKPKISCLMSESGGQAHASVRPRAVMIHTAQSGNSCMLLQRNSFVLYLDSGAHSMLSISMAGLYINGFLHKMDFLNLYGWQSKEFLGASGLRTQREQLEQWCALGLSGQCVEMTDPRVLFNHCAKFCLYNINVSLYEKKTH